MAHLRILIATVAALLCGPLFAADGCTIVYGANWAFMFDTPETWVSACGVDKEIGAPVALWPRGWNFAAAPVIMYINVVSKEDSTETTEHFAQGDLEEFKAKSPPFSVSVESDVAYQNGKRALVRRLTPVSEGNHEMTAYVDAYTVFAIIAVSARNADALAAARGAFQKVVEGFVPMEKK